MEKIIRTVPGKCRKKREKARLTLNNNPEISWHMKKSRRTYNGVHLNKKSNTQDVVEQSLTTNRRTMKYQAENTVSSFFYYMWNAWSEEECKTVYGGMYPHFWEKWCVATDKGTFGAAERFYLELSEDNRRLLVERAVSIYDGRGLRNRNRNIKNQTACRETLSV